MVVSFAELLVVLSLIVAHFWHDLNGCLLLYLAATVHSGGAGDAAGRCAVSTGSQVASRR